MKSFIAIALATTTLAIILGCSSGSTPAPSADAPAEAAPLPAQPAETDTTITTEGENKLISVTHEKASCEAGISAKVNWDTSSVMPSVASTKVTVNHAQEEPKTFAGGGTSGKAETGPWVYPGTTFVLYDTETNQQLDRLVVSGPDCLPQG